jgi:hypothetical protein
MSIYNSISFPDTENKHIIFKFKYYLKLIFQFDGIPSKKIKY